MPKRYPLVVIGAGPGGLCAATAAASLGISVLVLDEQTSPGGQIYRGVAQVPARRAALLGTEYQRGAELVAAFAASDAEYWAETTVWSLDARLRIGILRQGQASIIQAERVIVASGATERPVPFPGWTLPGVMNVGAAQILLKSAGVVPADGTVIAGTGPLLLLVAWQYLRAGVSVQAVLDLAPFNNLWRAAPTLPRALTAGNYLTRGLKYALSLKKNGVPIHYAVSSLQAEGSNRVETVTYDARFTRPRRRESLVTRSLLTHFGLTPRVSLTRAAGCHHRWDPGQQCWRPQVDEWGNTTIPGLGVVGDCAGIAGAVAAEHSARLAAREAARALGLMSSEQRDRQSRKDRRQMRADQRVRPFLESLHHLPRSLLVCSDEETLVCRCEEITAGAIRKAVRGGHWEPEQIKSYLRCGMGPCQGRQCASAVAHIVADERKQHISNYPAFRVRPPIRPLSIDQLAQLSVSEE